MKNYRAIDWRLRVPYGSMKENAIFTDPRHYTKPTYPESAKKFDVDLLIKEMDAAGVEKGVVTYRYGQEPFQKEECAYIKEHYGDRFILAPHINPYSDNIAEQIDDLVVNGPGDVITLEPGQHFIPRPCPADDPVLYPIYEKLEKENITLMMTFGGAYTDDIELYEPKYIEHVSRDFPKLKMVLAHGGYPYIFQIYHVAYRRKNVYLSPDGWAFPASPGHEHYATATHYALANQIVYGSCYPAVGMQAGIDAFTQVFGPDEATLTRVFHDNSCRALGWEVK